ncbi:flagellar biosynthetic protein FliR [Pseudodesulfovibrio tunisiensis]|uniref:flagellar biosynthetic protein FliR n=1 Tax=Pseudodesulfovibrio tunisiensis TaxID=463192 RepID=UPI001FB26B2A|nr:flagellar biosynthetic protein FliR [Pseudodesulfovibrio tunisiensis]
MDIFNFSPNEVLSFFLTLLRMSIVLFLLPFFGSQSAPKTVKAALLLVLAMAVWPQLSFPAELMPASPWEVLVMFIGEVLLGLTLALAVNIFFAAIQTGGQIMGFQMGFAMVNVVDPVTGVSNAVTAHFLYMCTMLTFLVLNGHLFLLKAVGESFALVPPGGLLVTPELAKNMFAFSENIFILAIKIAAPIMASVFVVDLALAVISRAAPQMHVLVLGFPVKIAVGFLFLGMIFMIMSNYTGDFIQQMGPLLRNFMRAGVPAP